LYCIFLVSGRLLMARFIAVLIAHVTVSLSMLAYQGENVVFEVKPATYLSRLSVRSYLEYYPTNLRVITRNVL